MIMPPSEPGGSPFLKRPVGKSTARSVGIKPRGVAIHSPTEKARNISAKDAAARLGITEEQLQADARSWFLEPTYSIDEVAAHFGQQVWQIKLLVGFGLKFGQRLHPTRGGLFPTFKPSHKCRRIPLSAIERHKRHMARVHDGAAA